MFSTSKMAQSYIGIYYIGRNYRTYFIFIIFIFNIFRVNEITTISPPGLTKSSLVESSADQEYFVTVTWSPQPSQFGANIFCFTASDSIG